MDTVVFPIFVVFACMACLFNVPIAAFSYNNIQYKWISPVKLSMQTTNLGLQGTSTIFKRIFGNALLGVGVMIMPNAITSTDTNMLRFTTPMAALALEDSTTATETTPATITNSKIEKVPLLTKRTSDLQPYADIGRGFKLLRPFGYNEFDGAGGGYAMKFASLFDVDENVIIGVAPAAAGKDSITDFGSLEQIGNKLAAKRGGKVVSSVARETDGVVFYQYEFENPVDFSLPRPKKDVPTKIIELYELCVNRGKLWSVQATSNDKLFPAHEQTLRASLASFFPRL